MEIGYDTNKDAANRAKHGVSLAFGARIFDDPVYVVSPTIRIGDEEHRYKAIGIVEGKLWTAVHVIRGTGTRLISVRRSNNGESRIYDRT